MSRLWHNHKQNQSYLILLFFKFIGRSDEEIGIFRSHFARVTKAIKFTAVSKEDVCWWTGLRAMKRSSFGCLLQLWTRRSSIASEFWDKITKDTSPAPIGADGSALDVAGQIKMPVCVGSF